MTTSPGKCWDLEHREMATSWECGGQRAPGQVARQSTVITAGRTSEIVWPKPLIFQMRKLRAKDGLCDR